MSAFAGCLLLVGALSAAIVGMLGQMALLYLMWNTLVVPTLGWPPVSFAGVVALGLIYRVAFRLRLAENAKDRRADTRTEEERHWDVFSDVVSEFMLLACAWAIYGVAYVVIR